jgi:hypothetical protein
LDDVENSLPTRLTYGVKGPHTTIEGVDTSPATDDAGASLTQSSEPARGARNSWKAPAFKFWNIVIWLRQTLMF